MNGNPVARHRRRLPGEIAFDRCFLPVAALFVLNIICMIITVRQGRSFTPRAEAVLAATMPPPAWRIWLPFTLGLLLAFLWWRAFVALVRTWHDPSFAVLRFSASVLLIPFAGATIWLLLWPLA